jgi:hypothetical protein
MSPARPAFRGRCGSRPSTVNFGRAHDTNTNALKHAVQPSKQYRASLIQSNFARQVGRSGCNPHLLGPDSRAGRNPVSIFFASCVITQFNLFARVSVTDKNVAMSSK